MSINSIVTQVTYQQELLTNPPQPARHAHLHSQRPPKILNKTPNEIQITAEQLLKDAEIHQQKEVHPPNQRVMDEDELNDYKLKRRKDYEDRLRRQRHLIGIWIRYATWEERLSEFRRARSVFERALEVDFKNIGLWLKYAEMEMRHKFINHAKNVWERAIYHMPRVDQFWYKYAYMEEIIGNYQAARDIFERWMTWKPEEKAWLAYAKFEERQGEKERQRQIMHRYMETYPRIQTYLKVAKFEIKLKNREVARAIYEKAIEDLGQDALNEDYFIDFALFEIRQKEYDRAREIFKFGLRHILKEKAYKLYQEYITFEKMFGSKEDIDSIILNKRRQYYKELIVQNPLNYDAWFDLVNLEREDRNLTITRETFENAVKNVPPVKEKRFWRRYIYLWYNYAVFEELEADNMENADLVYQRAIETVPHQNFTFSKLWILYAQFLVRNKDVEKMRKVFGIALAKCGSIKVYSEYIDLELQMANIDRVRIICEKFIQAYPDNPISWIKFAEFEKDMQEYDRYRKLFELALENQTINMPETVWRAYIDNEIQLQEYDNVRSLYERLLQKSKHVKIFISYAQFEASIGETEKCRKIMEKGEQYFKEKPNAKEERAILLEGWLEIEENQIKDQEKAEQLKQKQPKKVKKRRKIKQTNDENEDDLGYEEYYDFIFPEDGNNANTSKFLQKAFEWKQQLGQKETQGTTE